MNMNKHLRHKNGSQPLDPKEALRYHELINLMNIDGDLQGDTFDKVFGYIILLSIFLFAFIGIPFALLYELGLLSGQ